MAHGSSITHHLPHPTRCNYTPPDSWGWTWGVVVACASVSSRLPTWSCAGPRETGRRGGGGGAGRGGGIEGALTTESNRRVRHYYYYYVGGNGHGANRRRITTLPTRLGGPRRPPVEGQNTLNGGGRATMPSARTIPRPRLQPTVIDGSKSRLCLSLEAEPRAATPTLINEGAWRHITRGNWAS